MSAAAIEINSAVANKQLKRATHSALRRSLRDGWIFGGAHDTCAMAANKVQQCPVQLMLCMQREQLIKPRRMGASRGTAAKDHSPRM